MFYTQSFQLFLLSFTEGKRFAEVTKLASLHYEGTIGTKLSHSKHLKIRSSCNRSKFQWTEIGRNHLMQIVYVKAVNVRFDSVTL